MSYKLNLGLEEIGEPLDGSQAAGAGASLVELKEFPERRSLATRASQIINLSWRRVSHHRLESPPIGGGFGRDQGEVLLALVAEHQSWSLMESR